MRIRLRARPFGSLLVLPALALGVAACGGGGNDENVDKILDDAFTPPIKSADMTLDTEFDGEGGGLDDPIKLKLSGPFKDNGPTKFPSFDLDLSAGGGGINFSGGIASSGDNLFVSFQGETYSVGEGLIKQINDASAEIRKKQGDDSSLKAFGVDPRSWVKNGKDEGSEDVAGVETTHIAAELDVKKMLEDLNELVKKSTDQLGSLGDALGPPPKPLSGDQIDEVADNVENPDFDVYVGKDDKALRRLSTDVKFDVPEDSRGDIGGLEKGEVNFSIQFADVGDEVDIKTPTDAKPISQLLNQILPGLGSQIPGLGGGSGSSGGSGLVPPGGSTGPDSGSTPPTSTGPTPEVRDKLKKFQKCVQDAAPSDTSARQKCLELLQ